MAWQVDIQGAGDISCFRFYANELSISDGMVMMGGVYFEQNHSKYCEYYSKAIITCRNPDLRIFEKPGLWRHCIERHEGKEDELRVVFMPHKSKGVNDGTF